MTSRIFCRSLRQLSSYRGVLDMGGAPGSHNIKIPPINANKNCKIRAVCFDFDLLTKSVAEAEKEAADLLAKEKQKTLIEIQQNPVLPDVSVVQQLASLLKVQLGGEDPSALSAATSSLPEQQKELHLNPAPLSDVRSKYAKKLNARLDGGLLGVDHAKTEIAKGDAAGHLAARSIAVKQGSSATRWMSMTGTGSMLQLLSNRSMQIILLPEPRNIDSDSEGDRMQQFIKQLPSVNFTMLVKEGTEVDVVLKGVLENMNLDPMHAMLVSDRDDYMKSAKDLGMVTCRVRPPNARRGNISSHYTIDGVADARDVVNEINGISFNAVLNG